MDNDLKNKILVVILIISLVFIISLYKIDSIFLKKDISDYKIKVYICGEVENPGVYELSYNSRLEDLLIIAKAKPNADLQNINLAKKLKDEDFIRIYPKNSNYEIKVNINKANLEELTKLPGISKKTALNILEYREKHGNFNNLSELLKIKGITIEDLEELKKYITF
ncbi:MAG: helix-hairpin-helix domain-containing protein [bacterium]|nr:helix-hairpin-helix domain-containing protein [bacterium]